MTDIKSNYQKYSWDLKHFWDLEFKFLFSFIIIINYTFESIIKSWQCQTCYQMIHKLLTPNPLQHLQVQLCNFLTTRKMVSSDCAEFRWLYKPVAPLTVATLTANWWRVGNLAGLKLPAQPKPRNLMYGASGPHFFYKASRENDLFGSTRDLC